MRQFVLYINDISVYLQKQGNKVHKTKNYMDTVIIQLTTPKTMKLLQELEELNLLRVLKKNVSTKTKLSEKYAGKLPVNIAEDLQKHIEHSRNEWDSNIN
jgi:hypothetical protein